MYLIKFTNEAEVSILKADPSAIYPEHLDIAKSFDEAKQVAFKLMKNEIEYLKRFIHKNKIYKERLEYLLKNKKFVIPKDLNDTDTSE
jgi:hypothetical protein